MFAAPQTIKNKLIKFYKKLGPGLITGASDDDPSGIVTYSQAGSVFGYKLLWTTLFTFPLMVVVQEMCGRIGLVTGNGLAAIIKKHYSKTVLYVAVSLLFFANTLNIGANLGAMASSLNLIVPLPYWFLLIIISTTIIYLEIKVPYKKYKNILKYLTLSLFSYVISFFILSHDYSLIFKQTFVPSIQVSKEYFMLLIAILGTTISPYLFFWQTSEEVEDLIDNGVIRKMGDKVKRIFKTHLFDIKVDTMVGMLFSNLIMYFIIATTASTLFSANIGRIETATDAALALKPLGGEYSFFLFVFGILGTGFLSIPVLAGSSSYALSETLGWKEGLYNKYNKARGFYFIISLSTFIGLLVNLLGIPSFLLLYYSAFINGITAPFLLIIILFIANSSKIMGKRTNGRVSNFLGIITVILMLASILFFTMYSL